MFERFTDRARRVVVLAQEEARMLNHNYIGTEHILLGLIHEGEGVAAKALESLGISLDAVREQVQEIIGQGQQAPVRPHPLHARGPRRSLSCPCARRSSSVTTTSGPSTSCSASSARARASPRRCSSSSAPTSTGSASRSSSCCPATRARSRRPPAAPQEGTPSGSLVLDQFGRNLTQAGPRGQARPGHRAREGDRAGHAGAVPPDQEQPGPHRRARRRQDRRRRGPVPGHRARRGARDAQGQAALHASTSARWSPAPATAVTSRSG